MANLDFTFAWEGGAGPLGPWAHLLVVQFTGHEAIGRLSRYELTLIAKKEAGPVDPADLVGKRATLRIATLSAPAYRVVHGIIAEAREVATYPDGTLIQATLTPRLSRAALRKRSRIFLGKTLRQIVEAVLGEAGLTPMPGGTVDDDHGDPAYTPASDAFTWRLSDTPRALDPRARAYTVQYEESDLDFVSRLLEAEGIGFHVEDGAGKSLLVLADRDAGRAEVAPPLAGPSILGREVKHFHLGARLRSDKVVLGEYEWEKPALDMTAAAGGGALVETTYPGGYADSPAEGKPLAVARLERLGTEASFASGDGGIRVLFAGTRFTLEHPKARYEGRYLVTSLDAYGEQQGVADVTGVAFQGVPFRAVFDCARCGKGAKVAESRFRPARRVPWPRILSAQTAIVTAEPGSSAEIDVGGPDGLSIGCVRLLFPWDVDPARQAKEPTSRWVRVSQPFAGAGQGAVWHPRVGVEVIVDFEEGDPDRPLVTGRVYNGKNRPPYGGDAVHSTLKSFSLPGGGTWNEITFDDSAGGELVYMHAGKDMTSIVNHDRLEEVGADATMTVAVDDTETVGANETITVGADETLKVGANDTLHVAANSTTTIGANDTLTVAGTQKRTIGASQTITVGGPLTEVVTGAVKESVEGTRTTTVSAAVSETHDADRTTEVSGSNTQTYKGGQILLDMAARSLKVEGAMTITVNGTGVQLIGGEHKTEVTGPVVTNAGAAMVYITPTYECLTPDGEKLDHDVLLATGISLEALGAEAAATGVDISLAGASLSLTGLEIAVPTIHLHTHAVRLYGMAIQMVTCVTYLHLKAFTCIL